MVNIKEKIKFSVCEDSLKHVPFLDEIKASCRARAQDCERMKEAASNYTDEVFFLIQCKSDRAKFFPRLFLNGNLLNDWYYGKIVIVFSLHFKDFALKEPLLAIFCVSVLNDSLS